MHPDDCTMHSSWGSPERKGALGTSLPERLLYPTKAMLAKRKLLKLRRLRRKS